MNKISVIIPTFNSEKTILRCLDSVCEQSCRDLEIIIVDDHSSDATIRMVTEKVRLDKRIKIVENVQNMGAGFSRNVGLNLATGNYISFVDSDDFLHPKTYESVDKAILMNQKPDLVRFQQHCLLEMRKMSIPINLFSNNFFNQTAGEIKEELKQTYIALESPGLCNKVWSRDFIGTMRLPQSKWEDYPFSTPLFGKAKKILIIPEGAYYYCFNLKNRNTTLNDAVSDTSSILDIFDCCDLVEQRFQEFSLFSEYEKAVRGNQKIHALQRIRDVLFSIHYRSGEKKALIENFIKLIELKYGSILTDEYYQKLKQAKPFYRMRMNYVENFCYPKDNSILKEAELKGKIRQLLK